VARPPRPQRNRRRPLDACGRGWGKLEGSSAGCRGLGLPCACHPALSSVVCCGGGQGHARAHTLAVRASQETPTCSRACAGVQLMGSGPQIRHHTVAHSTTIDEHCRPLPVGARRWRLRSDLAGCSVLQLFCPATSVPVQRGSHSTARRSSARQPGSSGSRCVHRQGRCHDAAVSTSGAILGGVLSSELSSCFAVAGSVSRPQPPRSTAARACPRRRCRADVGMPACGSDMQACTVARVDNRVSSTRAVPSFTPGLPPACMLRAGAT
jgi:hypothetical protein